MADLTDLIAAHRLKQSYWNWWGCTGCDWRTKGTYGSEPTTETATEHAKHVVEQHTNGRITELEAELAEVTDKWGLISHHYRKAEATIARVKDAIAGLPACDKYGPDDAISCGWKNTVADVIAAVEGEQR